MKQVVCTYDAFRPWYDDKITMSNKPRRFGHLTTSDNSLFLCLLAKRSKGPIIEFGTFTGRTAYDMSLNTDQLIYTIDLGADCKEGYDSYLPGEDFINATTPNKPTLILGDSRVVDIPVAPGTAGFIFIDGGHSYDVVKSDSARAFELIRPDGVILWDDYHGSWPGVRQYIDELSAEKDLLFLDREAQIVWGLLPISCTMTETV